ADLIYWDYRWTHSPTSVRSDFPGDGGWVTLLRHDNYHHAAGATDLIASDLRAVSTAPPDAPAHFTDSPYALTLTIKDRESGVEGSLTFTGALSGTLSSLSSNLHNRWTSPRTQRLHLGHHIYIVRIGSFLPPGPPDHQFLGSISAHVRVVHNP